MTLFRRRNDVGTHQECRKELAELLSSFCCVGLELDCPHSHFSNSSPLFYYVP
jgi:hypothetical protein